MGSTANFKFLNLTVFPIFIPGLDDFFPGAFLSLES